MLQTKTAEFWYNFGIDNSLYVPGSAQNFGMGLTGLNVAIGGMQIHHQFEKGGIKNVNPIDATNVGAGFVGLASSILSKIGIGGAITSVIGKVAGHVGTAIYTFEIWWMMYKKMDDLRYAPLYILPNGEEVWEVFDQYEFEKQYPYR